MSKSILFLVKSFLGNFYRHLAILFGHTDQCAQIGQVFDLLSNTFSYKGSPSIMENFKAILNTTFM